MRGQPGFPDTRRFALAVGACAWLLVLFGSGIAVAKEEMTDIQREAEEAAKEDEADRAKGEGFEAEQPYSGRLVLGQVADKRPDIVGYFTIEKKRAYPIKLGDPSLLAELKPYNQKRVTLQGKFRNQGKYFVITGIIPPPAPTPRVQKIGGL